MTILMNERGFCFSQSSFHALKESPKVRRILIIMVHRIKEELNNATMTLEHCHEIGQVVVTNKAVLGISSAFENKTYTILGENNIYTSDRAYIL